MALNMFNQLQECITKIVFVFGPQTAVTMMLETPTTMKVTVLVFIEVGAYVRQVQVETLFELGQPSMAPMLWTTNVVEELRGMINKILKDEEKYDE